MRLVVEIDASGAAFEDLETEAARLLRQVVHGVESGYDRQALKDINGNTCGEWRWEEVTVDASSRG